MIADLHLPQPAVDALAQIIRHAARERSLVVDLRCIFGLPPASGMPWRYELTPEGLQRSAAANPALADDCRRLLKIHAANRGH